MNFSIGEALKAKRKAKNLKVKDVLDALSAYGVEIKDKTLYGWEAGYRQPDADELLILCQIYGIESISELRHNDNSPVQTPFDRLTAALEDLNPQQAMFLVRIVEAMIASKGGEVYAAAKEETRRVWEGD